MQGRLETILSIENVRVKAYHGWYDIERKIGGMYSISVKIYSTSSVDESYESIDHSINYEDIYDVITSTMKEEFKLIEQCCKTLWDRLKPLSVQDVWEVTLVKEDVPIKHVGATSFVIKG